MYLSQPFAEQGSKVVEFLKTKLAGAQDDLTIRDVIRVFVEMSRRGTYDVAKDPSLMRLLTERAAGIKDAEWRRVTDQMLRDIRR